MKLSPGSKIMLSSFAVAAAATAVWPHLPEGGLTCRPTTFARDEYEVIGVLNRQQVALAPVLGTRDGDKWGLGFVFRAYMTSPQIMTMQINDRQKTCKIIRPGSEGSPLTVSMTYPWLFSPAHR